MLGATEAVNAHPARTTLRELFYQPGERQTNRYNPSQHLILQAGRHIYLWAVW